MDSTNSSSARQVRLPLKDAERVLAAAAFVRIAEADPKLAAWRPEDTAAALAEAERQAGESADRTKMMLAAADIVAARAAESAESRALLARISKAALPAKAFSNISAGIIFAAFAAGAAADQWATNGRFINLLALPTLGVILWNVLIYVWLFVGRFSQPRFFGGLRSLLLKRIRDGLSLRGKRLQPKILGKASKSGSAAAIELYIRQQLRMLEPALMKKTAFTLHFSAAAFALGLIASVAARGFSTAYVVGWESTWLADNPDLVGRILEFFYSWLPDLFFGPHDLTAQTIASMNFANLSGREAWRLSDLSSSLSAAWLLRMIGAIIFAVILPRLLLGLWNAFSAEHALSAVAVPADPFAFTRCASSDAGDHAAGASAPTQSVRPTDADDALWVVLVDQSINAELAARKAADGIAPAAQALSARGITAVMTLPINVWEDPDDIRMRLTDAVNKLADEKPALLAGIARKGRLALWISAAATPEDDVHGEFLAMLRSAESFGSIAILADTSSLAERFAAQSEIVKSKMRLWRQFAEAHGAAIRFVRENAEPR